MNICFLDRDYIHFSHLGDDRVTTSIRPGHYAFEDTRNGPQQIVVGLRGTGNFVTWEKSDDLDVVADAFAKSIRAKRYHSREAYDAARADLAKAYAEMDW